MKLGKSLQIDGKQITDQVCSWSGQTMAEYAVVLGVITLAIVTSIATLTGSIQNLLNEVAGLIA
jgi:Flp pilus assembly pilin Flp